MKIRLAVVMIVAIIALTACSVNQAPARECVSDTLLFPAQPAYSLAVTLPSEAVLCAQEECRSYYALPGCELFTEVFPAVSAQAGIAALTGREDCAAVFLLLSSFPEEEYRLSWTVAGETGAEACRCVMFFDGSHCYALRLQYPLSECADGRELFGEMLAEVRLEHTKESS